MNERYLTSFEDQTSALDYTSGDTTLVSPQVSLIGTDVVYSKEIPSESRIRFAKDEETGKLYFIVDVVGPADNEIWYTTFDNLSRSIVVVKDLQEEVFYNVVSQQYVNGMWKCTFNESLTSFHSNYGNPIFDELIYPDDLEYNGMIYLPSSISYFDTLSVLQNYNIYYNGTKEQWKSVTIKNVAEISLTIHCTDGDIVIPARG